MDKIIITVKQYSQNEWFDVELPLDVPIGELAAHLVVAFGWEQGDQLLYELEVDPPGRLMLGSETLAQAGVWDGAWLVFHKKGDALPVFPTQTHVSGQKTETKSQRIQRIPQPVPIQRNVSPSLRQLPDLPPVPNPQPIQQERIIEKVVPETKSQQPLTNALLPQEEPPTSSPLIGWRGFEIPSAGNEDNLEEEPGKSNYSWKRLEE